MQEYCESVAMDVSPIRSVLCGKKISCDLLRGYSGHRTCYRCGDPEDHNVMRLSVKPVRVFATRMKRGITA